MKTIVGVLCLLTVLSILGVLITKDLRSVATAAGGSSAVIYSNASSATSLQQVQKNIDLSAETVVKQGQPNFNDD